MPNITLVSALDHTVVTELPKFDMPRPGEHDTREMEAPAEISLDEIDIIEEPARETESPLLGQTDASAAIHAGVDNAFTVGAPTLVALEGPRGSGKTRLLIHASEIAARTSANVFVLYGDCRSNADDTYAPFSRMLLERFGVTPASSPSAVRATMSNRVGAALGSHDPVRVGETTHLLGHIAGVPFPDSPFLAPLENKPEELHRRACRAFRRWVEGEAQSRPVLILLDDMHHAERAAWDVIGELTRTLGHLAIVLAGDEPVSIRADRFKPPGGVAIGPIAPLSEQDIQSMLHVLLPDLEQAPEPLVAAVQHRSGGNPSAARELVFALFEAGLFVREGGSLKVDLSQLNGGSLPVSMEDAIQARINRLDGIEQATLGRAAVLGEVFWDAAILAQMRAERRAPGTADDPLTIWPDDHDADALTQALLRLQEKGFIEANDHSDLPGAHEYTFALAGTREHVYDALEEKTRVSRHAAVARWLGLVAEVRREGVASMVAPHLEHAGQPERAGRAYLEGAIYERRFVRTERAMRYVEKALRLLPAEDVVRRTEALLQHGSLLTTLGRYDEALAAFTDMLSLAWQTGARGKGGAALNRIARVHRSRGENDRAAALLNRALELFRAAGDIRGVASTLDDLAQVALLRGDRENAMGFAHEALEIRRAHADQRGEAVSLNTLGAVHLHCGNFDDAEALLRGSLELHRRIDNRPGALRALNSLGVVAHERGDRNGAIAAWNEALESARAQADRKTECVLLGNIGEARLAQGELGTASNSLTQAMTLATELGDRRAMADIQRNRALLAMKRGDDDATEAVHEAMRMAEQYGAPEAIALASRALGEFHARTLFDADGQLDRRAEEAFLASIDLFQEIGNEREAARSLVALAQHLVERGDRETAQERLREARAIFRRMGLPEAAAVEQTLAELQPMIAP